MSIDAPCQGMRVAFIEYDLQLGGGLVFVLDLAAELKRRGAECHVFSLFARSSMAEDFARLQIPTSFGGSEYSILEDRLAAILTAMGEFAPTVVVVGAHVETCEVLRYVPPDLPRIAVFHLVLRPHLELAALYREFFQSAVGVSAVATEILRELLGKEPPSVRCIELGVNRPREERRPAPADWPLRILYLGRLEDQIKRVRLFPTILAQLKAADIPFVWTIAGEGAERAFLESAMPSEPGAQVVFRGLVPRPQIQALLAEHDVFLLASTTEAYPLGLHEAMAAGVVPVVSAIPGRVCEIVTRETGVLVPIEQVDGYAAGIIALHRDRAGLAAKCLQAQRRIEPECSLEGMADRWMPLLSQVADAPPVWKPRTRLRAPLRTPSRWRFTWAGRQARRCWHLLQRLFKRGTG